MSRRKRGLRRERGRPKQPSDDNRLHRRGFNFQPLEPGVGGRSVIDRRTSRDRAIGYTIAPLPARQVWELHRAREESRQLSKTSPTFKQFLRWALASALGTDPFELAFPAVPRGERARLREVMATIRALWMAYQKSPIGAAGETMADLVSRALWGMLVDGDAFIIQSFNGERMTWAYRLYQGDALSETQTQTNQNRTRVLGVDLGRRGRPMGYWFGHGSGVYSYAYSVPYSPVRERYVNASRVWHIRDMRQGGGIVRGDPWATAVLSEIPRLDDFYDGFIRAAIERNSLAVALETNPEMVDESMGAPAPIYTPGGEAGDTANYAQRERRYQFTAEDAGRFLEIAPGYKTTALSTGHPSSQEAQVVEMLEHRVTAGLGVAPTTLLGNYKGVSYSAGQLLRHQESATVRDLQEIVRGTLLSRLFRNWWMMVSPELMMRFPELTPDDEMGLMMPRHVLPRYQVLDLAKTIPAVNAAFQAGLLDLVEARSALGYATPDPDAYREDVQEEPLRSGGGGTLDAASTDDEGDDEDDEDDEGEEG